MAVLESIKSTTSGAITMKPMYPHLNTAVTMICNILMPEGFDTTADEYKTDSLEKIYQYYRDEGRVLVWTGASDNTIFGDPSVNHAFRAWHDYIHITKGFAFNVQGERLAYLEHCKQIDLYLSHRFNRLDRLHMFRMLDIEVNYQACHMQMWGEFPVDQRAFMKQHLTIG